MGKEKFEDFRLSSELLKSISILGYEEPTEVQAQVIPAILGKKDVVVKSQTGSGKTAAFAIPLCELLVWEENSPQALVLEPTRELALQVKKEIFSLGRFKRIKVPVIFGKSNFYNQEKELKQKTHCVVATPGRILDHLERETIDVSKVKYLVIDEADEMFNMGFVEQIEAVIRRLPQERVTVLLSATMPENVAGLCSKYMKDPIYVEIEDQSPALDRIIQERFDVSESDKLKVLKDILVVENPDSCIIFCNTRLQVDEVYEVLTLMDCNCERIHGGMEQSDRMKVMKGFKTGRFRYLIATDVAARGIDVDSITLVINFDVPQDAPVYVHRIGRTGRIGNTGRALTFVAEDERRYLSDIEKYIGKEIPLKERPGQEHVRLGGEEFAMKTMATPEIKEEKNAKLDKDIMRLHINAGRKTKMRPVDIVGTICSIEGLTAEDIGIINIQDISTFVEILNKKGEIVLRELQNKTIKGRIRKVSVADSSKFL
ncbi:DEAD/DEAH box helicase [Parasporobacterium paucivorans]|uniref:ATP-dependent RNA helicase DbpA n=1 Tax=Parasporobacterium paucivorans DSM 15970 TaxID=1122934 RepID=A0A1M6IAT9_9FIRM|nr:DEAD/DEAH box helicase [Parasporobacterium paucivorans]SHJ31545.1 ATP-dependent RNA helicase DbpA [Parasporobacterium paucivorans DSM 15970]